MDKVKLKARADFGLGPGKANRIEAGQEFYADSKVANVLTVRGFAVFVNEEKKEKVEKELKQAPKTKELKADVKTKSKAKEKPNKSK